MTLRENPVVFRCFEPMPVTPPKEDHLWDAWCKAQLMQDHIDIMRLWKRIPARVDEWFGDFPFGINAAGTTTTTTTTTSTTTTTQEPPPVTTTTTTTTTTTCSCGAFSTTIISDTFTDGDGTDLTSHSPDIDTPGGGWSIIGGGISPQIQSNSLRYRDSSFGEGRVQIESDSSNGLLTFDSVLASGTGNFRIRQADDSNYISIQFTSSAIDLVKVVGGSPTVLDSASGTFSGSHSFSAEFCCNEIEISIDGSPILNATESALRNETGLAIFSGPAIGDSNTFDDFLFKGE